MPKWSRQASTRTSPRTRRRRAWQPERCCSLGAKRSWELTAAPRQQPLDRLPIQPDHPEQDRGAGLLQVALGGIEVGLCMIACILEMIGGNGKLRRGSMVPVPVGAGMRRWGSRPLAFCFRPLMRYRF